MVRTEKVGSEDEMTENTELEGVNMEEEGSIAEMYAKMLSERKTRSVGGPSLGAQEARSFVTNLMNEQGTDELVFSVVAQVISTIKGKKMYNQLRSAITAKNSEFYLEKDGEGVLYVKRG